MKVDAIYYNTEQKILEKFVKDELKLQGVNSKKLVTESSKKRIYASIIFYGIALLSLLLYYLYGHEVEILIPVYIVILIIYKMIKTGTGIVKNICKNATANPDEKISSLVSQAVMNNQQLPMTTASMFWLTTLAVILISSLIFIKPRIFYQEIDGNYYVSKCTKGIIGNDDIYIPKLYNGRPVVGINQDAFANSWVSKVTLPSGLTEIHANAFYRCWRLTSVGIPATVTEIRASAFECCTALTSIEISEGVKQIRGSAFKDCMSLTNITLPNSLEYLGALAFSGCSSLVEITIPPLVTEINGQTFEYCESLERVNLHDNVTSIHGENFVGCTSLKSFTFPEGVTRIGGHTFEDCSSLTEVIVPSTVEEIGSSAFRRCTSLKEIYIPSGASVNSRAFKESPTKVYYY